MEAGDKWWSWFGLLAGKFKERAWLRWILQNWNEIIGWYCFAAVFMTVWLAGAALIFEPHSFTAKGLTFRAGDWVGFLMALAWVVFQGAAAPIGIVAVVLSPVLVLVFVVGGSLWLLGLFLGSVALVGFGPFVVLFGGRALFLRKLARWFGEADKRVAEERGVMAALGLGDAPERSLDGKARLMGPEEVAKYNAKPSKGAQTMVGDVGGRHIGIHAVGDTARIDAMDDHRIACKLAFVVQGHCIGVGTLARFHRVQHVAGRVGRGQGQHDHLPVDRSDQAGPVQHHFPG